MELSPLLQESLSELGRGGVDRKHPFRFVHLATVTPEGLPDSRMLVLRQFDPQRLSLKIYTDARSRKTDHLAHQPIGTLLFWHPKKRWQFKVKAAFEIHTSGKAQELYQQLPQAGQASYNTLLHPGTPVSSMKEAHQLKAPFNGEDFAILEGQVQSLEVLRLQKRDHVRAKFTFEGQQLASMDWLVP